VSSAIFLTPAPRTSIEATQREIDKTLAQREAQLKQPPHEPNYPQLSAELAGLQFQLTERQRAIKLVSASVKDLKAFHERLVAQQAQLKARRQTSEVAGDLRGVEEAIHRLVHTDNRGRPAGLLNDEVERLKINEGCAASLEKLIANFQQEHPGVTALPGGAGYGRGDTAFM
jgi:chromosome segregation ATPase